MRRKGALLKEGDDLREKIDAHRYFSFPSISRYTTSWAANVGVGDIVAQRLFIIDESQPK
jgi:hypothetical protein